MGKYEILIGSAGMLGIISFSTLVFKVFKDRNTESLHWEWLILNIIGQILSFIYGIVNGAYGIYITNTIFLIGLFYILYVKVDEKNKNKNKK